MLAPPQAGSVAPAACGMHDVYDLGSGIISTGRLGFGQVALFCPVVSCGSIRPFPRSPCMGETTCPGLACEVSVLRRWGVVDQLGALPEVAETVSDDTPVVAVTLARMRLRQVPRFVRWGRPVETFVRDAPGAILAAAAMRLPRTISTFSIWERQRDMLDMVWRNDRHHQAMQERDRKDFHHQFTTLRFRALSEHGSWQGRSNYVPGLDS